jgi:hypothetical protein
MIEKFPKMSVEMKHCLVKFAYFSRLFQNFLLFGKVTLFDQSLQSPISLEYLPDSFVRVNSWPNPTRARGDLPRGGRTTFLSPVAQQVIMKGM